jgi:peptidyl-prolyl cis-trans isomerase C
MNRYRVALATLPLLLFLGGCGNAASPAAATDAVATVNGKPIAKSEFDLYLQNVQQQAQRELTAEEKSQVLDQFISMKLAAEAAEKAGVAKQQKVEDQLALARMNVIVDAGLQKYLEDNPVSDAELKPEYDAQVAQMPREYHARHILVEDKATADAITKDLKGGADFAKLAEQKSKDSSAQSGGDLGWFTLDTMVKPFGDAVAKLQPGELTQEPVQSQFGWHVIKLEETRAPAAPAFEDVKDRVRSIVQRKKLQSYLEELRKAAKIEKKI